MPSDITKYEGPQMKDEALRLLGEAHLEGKNVDRYTDEVLRLIGADVHPHSKRPCETCRRITAMIGKPFWCSRVALEKHHAS